MGERSGDPAANRRQQGEQGQPLCAARPSAATQTGKNYQPAITATITAVVVSSQSRAGRRGGGGGQRRQPRVRERYNMHLTMYVRGRSQIGQSRLAVSLALVNPNGRSIFPSLSLTHAGGGEMVRAEWGAVGGSGHPESLLPAESFVLLVDFPI